MAEAFIKPRYMILAGILAFVAGVIVQAPAALLYGWLAPFWQAYRVRFPGVDEAGAPLVRAGAPLKLLVTSAVGQALPVWAVEPHDLP